MLTVLLGAVFMLHAPGVDGVVERAIFTTRELNKRLQSSFYVLGVSKLLIATVWVAWPV